MMVHHTTGSFTVAGAAIGAFGTGNVAASPLRARALDHHGHATTLVALTGAYCTALAVLVFLPPARHGTWVPVALAAAAGATLPPFGISMRLLLADLHNEPGWRERVYSIDATTEEVTRTIGPLLAAAAVSVATPSAGIAAVVILDLAAAATLGPAASRPATPPAEIPSSARTSAPLRVLRNRSFALTLALLSAAGAVLGVLDVAAVAAGAQQHHPSASGPLLAVLSAGSALGGVLYGRHPWRRPPAHRLLVACAILATLTATLAAAPNLEVMGGLLFLAGLPISPILISTYLLADNLIQPAGRARATTWVNTSCNAGISAGSALAGGVAQHLGTPTTFVAAALLLTAATLIARGLSPTGACLMTRTHRK
jgi:predicted MFS family arabinose efflux permease